MAPPARRQRSGCAPAGLYQLIHAVAVLTIMGITRGGALLLLIGAAIFAVSLYAMGAGLPALAGRGDTDRRRDDDRRLALGGPCLLAARLSQPLAAAVGHA